MEKVSYKAYIKSSFRYNEMVGAYGIVITKEGNTIAEICGRTQGGNLHLTEFSAFIRMLNEIPPDSKIKVYSSNKYAIEFLDYTCNLYDPKDNCDYEMPNNRDWMKAIYDIARKRDIDVMAYWKAGNSFGQYLGTINALKDRGYLSL